jgi:hypothetical protein
VECIGCDPLMLVVTSLFVPISQKLGMNIIFENSLEPEFVGL